MQNQKLNRNPSIGKTLTKTPETELNRILAAMHPCHMCTLNNCRTCKVTEQENA